MEILLLLGVSAVIGAIMINRSKTAAALAPAGTVAASATSSLSSLAQTTAASLATQPVPATVTPQAILAQPAPIVTEVLPTTPTEQVGVISTATAAPIPITSEAIPLNTSQAIGQLSQLTAVGAASAPLVATAYNAINFLPGVVSVPLVGEIAAAVVAVVMIAKLIFKGADPNQVPAAKIEQVYECASNCMGALYAAGLISQATCLSLIGALITGAAQAEDNAPQYAKDPRPFRNGITNATSVLNAAISGVKGMAPIPLKTLTASAVSALCTAAPGAVPRAGNPAGTAGPPFNTAAGHWYANSVALGLKLTKQATDYLIANKLQ